MGSCRCRSYKLHQAQTKEEAGNKKRKISGWSTKVLEKVPSMQEYEDTEDMIQWRNLRQGIGACRKESCSKMEEELLERYMVEVTK